VTKQNIFTDFAMGVIVGFFFTVIVFCVSAGIVHLKNKNKELSSYVERQVEIEALQKDIGSHSADDFLEDPDIRRAEDGAANEFIRKRDEILQRFRSPNTD